MAGLGITLYLDENIDLRLVSALCGRGYDVCHAFDHGKISVPDEEHLRFATGLGRAVATHNFADFQQLHLEFLGLGEHHMGIVLIPVRQLAELSARLARHLDSVTPGAQETNVLWA